MAQFNITITEELLHGLFLSNGKDEAFSKLLEEIFNQVLLAQSTEQLGAEPYERTEGRTAYRNGTRERQLTTRIGTLTLRIPRHRNGQFSTELFMRYQRSEQALVLAMMEMVINGVSTRKIESITEELCGKKFSKSTISTLCKNLDPMVNAFRTRPLKSHYPFLMVDAIYVKVRENKRIQSRGLLIAIGINEEGHREVVGFQLANSESENSWGEFFGSLKERGLKDVRVVTSDDHKGLVNAVRKHFQGASWQRCQTHFSRNMLDHAPKALQPEIKEDLRRLYESVDLESARKVRDQIIAKYEARAPKATNLLDEAFDDITAVLALPLRYRKRLRTTNGVERLNEEIRRRERVIRIFPNEASVIRLMGALLMEQDEKWQTGRKYFDMELYYHTVRDNDSEDDTAA
ncbi:IS256 family transposase [Acetivibrio straminisolvens]|jgi:transposase-like protein|uniref:Mutator family transposase n=1 Tax=Acetivibrio straminisolvens JCM 21531 TaxID=1294263 RepID=W4V188_9FIRM|nr:IS256 family transposase [Acetivibrio straminisolvens]GAE87255.1 DNA polymerase IV [Acetivibrio straminisolvens JCM 21531]